MSKNYFGFLDSRNTKYQGVIRNDHFDGIGIAIDEQLNTVLSTWNKYAINGPSVIIFSSLEIFFGKVEDGVPKGVVCFQYSHKQRLFIKFETDKNTSQPTFTQVALTVHNSEIVHLQKTKDKQEYKIIDSFYSKSQDNTLKILSNIFSTQVRKYQIDLVEYLSHEFVEQLEVFQLTGSGKEIFFGFKGVSSLGFKLENGVPVAMGYWNMFPRNLMFGRKVYYNLTFPQRTKIQQGNFSQSSTIYKWAKSQTPSIDCVKSVEEYFKKSTTFRNQFTKLDQIKKIFNGLKQVEEKIKVQVDKKYGQSLLENQDKSAQKKNDQIIPKQYTLEEVKKQIYQAAAKKHSSFKPTNRSPFESSFKKQPKYTYENTNRSRGKYTDQYRVNEFNISYQAMDPYQGMILKQEAPQKGFTERNFKDTGKTKMDLVKNVDEIIKKRKQDESMFWNDLMINDKNLVGGSGQKYTERQNEECNSPITKRYRRYELKTGTNEKEQKYEAKRIPFMIESSTSQRKQTVRVVPQRRIKYLQAEKENQPQLDSIRMPKYDLFKPGADRIIERKQVDVSEFGQSKGHSNLAKYKDRLKDSTPTKQTNQKATRYNYLNQAQSKAYDDEMRTSQKLMSELKLFGIDKETSQKKFQRSFTDNGEVRLLQKDQHATYIASEHRQRPRRRANPFNQDDTSHEMMRVRPSIYDQNERKTTDKVIENESSLVKMYTFQDRNLSDKLINMTPPMLQTHKKPKRTYQYVE